MSTNKSLFQEAIADAKAVREAALANAKAALEEVITPRLQSMIDAKLNEEYYDENMEEDFVDEDINFDDLDSDMEDELNLEAILAELEGDETLEEAKDKDKDKEGKKEKKEKKDDMDDDDDELDLKDPKSLRDFIVDTIKDVLASGEVESDNMPTDDEMPEMPMDGKMSMDDEEEIDINELLAELESLDEEDDDYGYSNPLDEAKKRMAKKRKEEEEKKEKEKDLKEAISTIKFLRSELNEVNLLNAKLLFVNKIFKAKNLSESQKLNVIAAFDKATNVKEAKLVFESLNRSISAAPAKRNQIKESIGFASKAAGVAHKQQIIESNDVISRMQRLANIK
jgi:hypothetical protein